MKKSKRFIALCKKYGVDPDKVPEILSFEAACKDRKVDPKKLPVVRSLPRRHQKRQIADYKLTIIAEALREGKTVNYNDTDQYKYFALFEVKANDKKPSGFGLSCVGCDGWDAVSDVGVRLCFHDWNVAKFFGMHFISLHRDHHLYT